MKIRGSIISQAFFGIGLISLISLTACNTNQKKASATLPASPAAYPGSKPFSSGSTDASLVATEASKPKAKAPERKPEPFVLRDGETLVNHRVVSGDTLTRLAGQYGTEIRRIQSANGLTGSKILTGKSYKIPTMGDTRPASLPSPSMASTPPRPTPPPPVSRPTPPPAPSTPSTFRSPSLSNTYSRTAPPTFAPREIKYSNSTLSTTRTSTPLVISPTQSASSVTVPPVGTSGSGAAFPAPTFDSGSSF